MSLQLSELYDGARVLGQELDNNASRHLEHLMWIAAFHSVYQNDEVSAEGAAKAADAALEQYKKRFDP